MENKKCIEIIEGYINQNGTTEELLYLQKGIEKNVLLLDLIPTDLIKDLMPESDGLIWTRKADVLKNNNKNKLIDL